MILFVTPPFPSRSGRFFLESCLIKYLFRAPIARALWSRERVVVVAVARRRRARLVGRRVWWSTSTRDGDGDDARARMPNDADADARARAWGQGHHSGAEGGGGASRARASGIFAACFTARAEVEDMEGRATWSTRESDEREWGGAETRGGWTRRARSSTNDEGEASSDGSNRAPDFGIDRATYVANVSNGVESNEALRLWLKRREMWLNSGRRRRSSLDRMMSFTGRAKIPRDASYESFLGESPGREFKPPVPLGEMVRFLNECWEIGDGL